MNAEPGSSTRLLWFCLFAAVVILTSFSTRVLTPWGAKAGADAGGAQGDGLKTQLASKRFFIDVVSADGPALRAGIRPGDEIDERSSQRLVPGFIRNTFTNVTVIRDGRRLNVTIVPEMTHLGWSDLGRFLADMWTILFATLIAWRRKRWAGAAPLALILALGACGDGVLGSIWPFWQLSLIAHSIGSLTSAATFALLVRYFAGFGAPLSTARIAWTRIAFAAAALAALGHIAHVAGFVEMWVPAGARQHEFQVFEILITCPVLPAIVCGILAARGADATDAQRIGWVTASYGVFWSIWVISGQLGTLWDAHATLVWNLLSAAHLLVPLSLTYAALQRRLFDVGFIVNRAAVFTAVSAIVIGSFVLLEWALGKWFEGASHETGIALNAGLALTLGLGMRFLHRRVDGFVDSVFFRKRHENERALRRFAHEVTLVTEHGLILERTASEILDHSEASGVTIINAASLDLNDPAVLALRAWQEPIELARYKTSLAGEWAFPLVAHGNLAGTILCGPKRNEEAYAPDEIDSLKAVAHGVSLALWSLDAGGDSSEKMAEVLAELRALRAMLSPPISA